MVICIASGKGGTGKTTIATNLAVSLDGNVQLLDCDVEEPNAHLFMKHELNHT
ncbi:MAG: P-loop NTPase, partial [Desulfobacterales bacterium]|nr:P-loop NTPase [Desulfobacterales bacterium]